MAPHFQAGAGFASIGVKATIRAFMSASSARVSSPFSLSPPRSKSASTTWDRPRKDKIAEDNFHSFLIGMKAADAKRRYELKLVKEDVNYLYIEVKPRNASDLADFSLAQLALTQKTFLPRMLIYTAANGNNPPGISPSSNAICRWIRRSSSPRHLLVTNWCANLGWMQTRSERRGSSPVVSSARPQLGNLKFEFRNPKKNRFLHRL